MSQTNRGGARRNAGRPKGSRNKATITMETLANEAAVKLAAAGISNEGPLTPSRIAALNALEVLSFAMVQAAAAGNWREAADIAAKIAPYKFAKMQHVTSETTIRRSVEELSDDELLALVGTAGDEDEGDEAEAAD